MPSPFPGMDPYLENPALWPGVHHHLLSYAAEDLQPHLLPRYVAAVEERVFPELEVHEGYIEIRDLAGNQLVTVIEVLSPTNKAPGAGRDAYVAKQQQVLRSATNLVEGDLLRQGLHTVACPRAEIDRRGRADYVLCTRRADRPGGFEVIRVTVRDPLPSIAIPLKPGDTDVTLHLPQVFARCYETGAYPFRVNYIQPPEPPLAEEDVAWAAEVLRQQRAPS